MCQLNSLLMFALSLVFLSAGFSGLLEGVDAQDYACGDANGVAGSGPGAYPWAVVVYHERLPNELPCMGTLITPQIVLIAATCFGSDRTKPENIKVLLGKDVNNETLVLGLKTNLAHPKLVNVSDVIIHPPVPETYILRDLALLGLSEEAQISADIMPACVQWQGKVEIPDGIVINGNGWSRNVDGQAVHQEATKSNSCGLESCQRLCALSGKELWLHYKSFGAGATIKRDNKHFFAGLFLVQNRKAYCYESPDLTGGIDWIREQKESLERKLKSINTCILPDPPFNRTFASAYCPNRQSDCSLAPGTAVTTANVVSVTCSSGYYMPQGVDTFGQRGFTICEHGLWDPNMPQCYKLCSPLKSQTVDFQCYQRLTLLPCDKPMLPGTTVSYGCKEYHEAYEKNEINSLKCNPNGEWSKNIPSCKPKCGISNLDIGQIRPTIVGGDFSKPGNFPWHAGIFHKKSDKWEAKCGGTLISTRAILTAAHCVTINSPLYKSPTMDPKDVMVSLGKNLRLWDSQEDTGIKRQIKEILVHPDYVGSSFNYANDIAVIMLETEAPVNTYIEPACVDFNLIHLEQLKQNSLAGYVAGWGNTEDCSSRGNVCSTPSDVLKFTRTNIVNFTECLKTTQKIKPLSFSRLTTDKYCAGNGSESVVQQGDSGGGLTFKFDGLHYIYGVVSVKLKLELNDNVYYNFGGFTSVSTHLNWLKSQLI